MIIQSIEKLVCEECNNTGLVQDLESGELVCQVCGYVISTTMIDQSPEWRAFNFTERDKLPRVGAPTKLSIHDMGLSTRIGWQDKDHTGRKLSPDERARLYRLRKWDQRSKISDSAERNLAIALNSIVTVCTMLNLPGNIVETSSLNYRNALKRGLIRGRAIEGIAAASIYLACRQCEIVRSLDDIALASNIPKKEAARNYRFIRNMLNPDVPLSKPSSYISKLVSELDLTGETELLALEVLNRASEIRMTVGRAPSSMAAACVYISTLVTGEGITQGEIAKVAQVTEVTIRNRYKELVNNLSFTVFL